MKTIHLARGLTLPAAELATKVTGAFGIRGSGKSNLMAVVIEGMLTAGVQVIVMDPVGIHFSLRLAPSGKSPSPFQIPVLGGRHGDLVLQPTAGEVVGRALALSNDSCVLDISSMKKGERIRFSGAFFEAFYEGKKENSSPVLLCLEEAQRFAPQLMFKGSGQEQMLGAIEELAEQGRNYGAGIWLNSLRPQKINKDVTSLMDLLFSFRLTGNHERKFVHDWLQEKGAEGRDEIQGELPGLPEGNALVWSPAVFNIFGKYHFHKKTTYDAGATPLYARAKVKMRPLDLDNLEKEMATVVEEAKANDPRALKARVAELEHALKQVIPVAAGKATEKSVLKEADIKRLERVTNALLHTQGEFTPAVKRVLDKEIDKLAQAQQAVVSELGNLRDVIKLPAGIPMPAHDHVTSATRAAMGMGQPVPLAERFPRLAPRAVRATAPGRRESDSTDADASRMPEKCQKMLGALRQGEAMGLSSMPFRNVAVIAGVAPDSGTTGNRKGYLKNNGYITVQGDHVQLTDKGRDYPLSVELPPTDRMALLDFWKRQIKTEKIVAMLDYVVRNNGATDDSWPEQRRWPRAARSATTRARSSAEGSW